MGVKTKTEKQKRATVVASGGPPESVLDAFADALLQFIQAAEQEEKEEKSA
ncbi:MAG: hypothetical protein IJV46_06930 [Acidaminococcaceae bacterium]|nr:hypothetical protein [Acidaminococcaceae bacterium]